ncbi:MAG: dihydrodipicolinate reductase C-terminal domain-containing protein [Candidatus Carsonella ruddii]
MIKIFIFGITGKIGKEILFFLKLNKNFILLGGINKKNSNFLFKKKYIKIFKNNCKKTIFVNFSNIIILKKNLFIVYKFLIPILIGLTGLNIILLNYIKFVSLFCSILLSYNMSIGLNIINFFLSKINIYLKIYNFNSFIIDIHHNLKIDKPSGTSLILYSKIKKINKNIYSIRLKNVIGHHILYFISNNETIKIEHLVLNRNIFIIGIFYSLFWLFKKKKGCYSMYDVYF